MTGTSALTYVGAPDPELRNSPIISETDEDFESSGQEIDELPLCYFNGVGYGQGTLVCSGSGELLRCENGAWILDGTCDPDNI
jgi:hypothetical protein